MSPFSAPSTPELQTQRASNESLNGKQYRRHSSFQGLGIVSNTYNLFNKMYESNMIEYIFAVILLKSELTLLTYYLSLLI